MKLNQTATMKVEFHSGLLRALGTALAILAVYCVGVLAWARYTMLVVAGALILVGLFCGYFIVSTRRERDRAKRVDAAFREVYAQLSPLPVMEISGAYGFPAFKILFCSRPALEAASSRNAAFKSEIGKIYRDYGTRSNPFDADRALLFTYDGQ
ncbi:MAG: hypothetical protein HZA93_06360 [Verrucomicrobia bacterium]|nr:hypothetical protein [Verrucomicrobiota bacterium]